MKGRILVAVHNGTYLIKFVGDVRVNLSVAADDFFDEMCRDKHFMSVFVDLTAARSLDSTSLGILAKLSKKIRKLFNVRPTLVSTNVDITRLLHVMGFDDVFHIVEQPLVEEDRLGELPLSDFTSEDIRRRVLEAHKTLMGLNENNQNDFRDLIATLEAAASDPT